MARDLPAVFAPSAAGFMRQKAHGMVQFHAAAPYISTCIRPEPGRMLFFTVKGGDAVDVQRMTAEYEDGLARVRLKIQKLKLQEAACHTCGEHLAAWKLSRLRVQYEAIEGDLLYAMAEMTRTQEGGAAGG